MHIPEHVLDPAICVGTGIASTAVVGYAAYRTRKDPPRATTGLVAMTAAGLLAVQALNFPISANTSGHVLGGLLAAMLLGPWRAILTMTGVLLIQCLLFQDGGLSALGANVLNLAVLGSGVGYLLYSRISQRMENPRGTWIAAAAASWLSVMLAATACAVELSLSKSFQLVPTIQSLYASHAIIGLGEAFATGMGVAILLAWQPKVFQATSEPSQPAPTLPRWVVPGFLATIFAIVFAASPFASALPDGLEQTLQRTVSSETSTSDRATAFH